MMNFLYILLSAAVVENLLFSRGFATRDMITRDQSYRQTLKVGGLITGLATISSVVIWTFLHYFGDYFKTALSRYVVIVVWICLGYLILYGFLASKKVRKISPNGMIELTFSGSCLSAVVLAITARTTLMGTVAYTIGYSFGIIGAMFLLRSGKDRIEGCQPPTIFKGVPITLIYLGILGLGFYGLLGHQLPT